MRKKDLEKLILCLTPDEREKVISALNAHKKGKERREIFKSIIKANGIDAKMLCDKHKVSPKTLHRILCEIENTVILTMGSISHEPSLEMGVKTALRLVLRMEFTPALAIINKVFAEASRTEQFDVLFHLYELTEMMMRPVDLGRPTLDEVVALQHNLWTYEQLKVGMKEVLKGGLSVAETKERLREISEHPLMAGEEQALSLRARASFLWLVLRCNFHYGDYESGLVVQEKLIILLNENDWLRMDKDFFLIRENERLAGLYFKTDREVQGYRTIFEVGTLPSDHHLIEVSKLSQLFPLKTGLAIKSGDGEAAKQAIGEFEAHCERLKGHLSPYFLYRNWYFNAYFLFANGEFHETQLILSRYFQKSSLEIPPLFWPMAKILEIFTAYEQREVEDTIRLIKNFRMTNYYRESPFYSIVLKLLYRLCNRPIADHPELLRHYLIESEGLANDPTSTYLFNFFDVSAWINANMTSRKMLSEFAERATIKNVADIENFRLEGTANNRN